MGGGGDSGDGEQRRRRVGVRIGGVFAHVGDALDGPTTVALEVKAFDLTPQIRSEREKGSVFVRRGAKQRVRGFV